MDSYLDMTENYCNRTHAVTLPQLSACSSTRYASPRANAAANTRNVALDQLLHSPTMTNLRTEANFRLTHALARTNQTFPAKSVIPFLSCDLHRGILRAYSNKMFFTSLLFSQTQVFFLKKTACPIADMCGRNPAYHCALHLSNST